MKAFAITTAVLCLAGAAPRAQAQDESARRAAVEVAARVPFEKAVKGAPYSAETSIQGSQTLADGNRISHRSTGRVYRDSEGRTRREEDREDGSVGVSIVDPVAGFSYSLDPNSRTAWRTTLAATGAILGKIQEEARTAEAARQRREGSNDDPSARARAVEQEKRVVEQEKRAGGPVTVAGRGGAVTRAYAITPDTPLEHKTIEGVAVEGRKTTTVIPAGQIGNEQPLTIVSEEWRSPELNILVLTRHSDPRMGDSSYRVQNIIRTEPDPSLFVVPADYTVKDTGIRRMLEARQPGR